VFSRITRYRQAPTALGSSRRNTEAVWAKVEEFAFSSDRLDAERGLVPGHGLLFAYLQVLIAPLVAALLAVYAFFGSIHTSWAPAPWLETISAVLLGITGTQLKRLRLVSIAWTTTALIVAALDIAVICLAAH
jgi:hypothetical protein